MSGTTVGEAFVKIRPDTSGFESEAQSGVGKAASGLGKVFGVVAAGAAAIGGAHFLKGTIDEFVESTRVGKLTEAVIRSTGGAAGLTAQQFSDLANAQAAKTGVDDETIQSAENVLATFTQVRNETGKGNDIFTQATIAAQNMSAALGTDLQGSTIQLGKALNDPIKGITALSRAGVSFTAQQKEQIKTLVASGDTLGAQKLILSELGKEFAGAAEAAANPIDKLKVVLGNAKETIGGALFPVVNQLAPLLGAAVSGIAPVIAKALGGIVGALGPVLKAIIPLIGPVANALVTVLGAAVKGITPLFKPLAQLFSTLGPAWAAVAKALAPLLAGVSAVAGAFIKALVPVLKVLAPIIERIAGILAKGIGEALKSLAPVLPPLGKAFAQILIALAPLIPTLAKLIVALLPALTLQLRIMLPILTVLAQLFAVGLGEAVSVVNDVLTTLLTIMQQLTFDDIAAGLDAAGNAIGEFFTNLPGQILGFLAGAGTWLLQVGLDLIGGLWNGIQAGAGAVLAWFLGLPGLILGLLGNVGGWLLQQGIALIRGFGDGIVSGAGAVLGWVAGLPGRIVHALGDVGSALLQVGRDIVHGVQRGIEGAWHAFVNWVVDKFGGSIISAIGDALGIGSPSKVMADRVGGPIVHGIRMGIANAWGGLEADLRARAAGLGTNLNIGATVAAAGTLTGAGPGTSAGGLVIMPGAIVQHVGEGTDLGTMRQANSELVDALTRAFTVEA